MMNRGTNHFKLISLFYYEQSQAKNWRRVSKPTTDLIFSTSLSVMQAAGKPLSVLHILLSYQQTVIVESFLYCSHSGKF